MLIIKIGEESFELSDVEVKSLEYDVFDIKEWVENAVKNKARQCIDTIVEKHSDKQPKKIDETEKETIIMNADIKSTKERQAESEATISE